MENAGTLPIATLMLNPIQILSFFPPGTDAALLTSRAPLLEIQQKQYQEQKLFDERMLTVRQKFDKVRAGLKDFNEREIRRFQQENESPHFVE